LYIIAECAQGYAQESLEESISLAKWLVKSAKAGEANAVKFQLVIADELACPKYQHFDLFKSLELGLNGWREVNEVAIALKIDLIFDVFGKKSMSTVEELGVGTIKIHPTDFCNIDFLKHVSASNTIKHVVAGTGGATVKEIEQSLEILSKEKAVTLMHGFQGYPTPTADNCLQRLSILKKLAKQSQGKVEVGFADHSDPISANSTHLAAVSIGYGASVLEKHITLARCLGLEDHESALSPDEFKVFVEVIRESSEALGDRIILDMNFKLPHSEQEYRKNIARHVVSTKDLIPGQKIKNSDLCLKRTSCKKPLLKLSDVIGRKVASNILANSPIIDEDLDQ